MTNGTLNLRLRTIAITGGAGALGTATATLLSRAGARVVLVDNDAERLANTAKRLGPSTQVALSGLESVDACRSAFAAAGPLDGLVHFAGVYQADQLDHTLVEVWNRVIFASLTTAANVGAAFASARRSDRRTSLVFVSSLAATSGSLTHTSYSAAKAGLIGLTRSLARRLAPESLVNCIAPGLVHSPMAAAAIKTQGAAMLARVPLQRFALADEIAGPVAFLMSDLASYITGQTLRIDGGATMG